MTLAPWEQPEAVLAERVGTAQAGRIMAAARAQAEQDREALARLVREGRVMRSEAGARTTPSGRAFIADIEERAFPSRKVNLAIRPKKKRR